MSLLSRIVDRYKHLPQVDFADKVRYAVWKHLSRLLQEHRIIDGTGELMESRFHKGRASSPRFTYKRLIFSCGFGWSGSGAVGDLLREYAPVTSIPIEFDLARAAGGLYNLEKAFDTCNIFERDAVFRIFMTLVDSVYTNSREFYDDRFLDETKSFLEGLIDYVTKSSIEFEHCPHLRALGTRAIRRIFGLDSIVNEKSIFFLKEMSVLEYRKLAAKYIRAILSQVEARDCLLMDQGCADCSADLDRFGDYFGPFKAIYTYRDPRDVFASAYLACQRGEERGHIPSDPAVFVRWYKRALEPFRGISHPNLMLVRFEDLVIDSDKVIQQIESFLGFTKSDHVHANTLFVPEESCAVSMGLWRDFPDQNQIHYIGERLSEFCFNRDYVQPKRQMATSTGVTA